MPTRALTSVVASSPCKSRRSTPGYPTAPAKTLAPAPTVFPESTVHRFSGTGAGPGAGAVVVAGGVTSPWARATPAPYVVSTAVQHTAIRIEGRTCLSSLL